MKPPEEIKRELIKLKPYLYEKYKVKEIGIFGSYVKGKQKKRSDLDILVDFFETPTLFEFIQLEYFLTESLGVKVDLVSKGALKPYIGKIILKEVVYI